MAARRTVRDARFLGVVHLPPLPGSPRGGTLEAALQRALDDARTLRNHGADGLIVENLGDAPFERDSVCASTVASMTVIASRVRELIPDLAFGVNVLRNDAMAALSIATATDADFIRVNIHTGAMVTDQGIIQGLARQTLLERNRLQSRVVLAADVMVKHASPLGRPVLEDLARDTVHRGLASVLIVTGTGTGRPHAPDDVKRVQRAVPNVPVWVGSGIGPESAKQLHADAAIVGSWLHQDGDLSAPLSPERVRAMADALNA